MVQIRWRSSFPAASFFALASSIALSDARAIFDFPLDTRKTGYVRLSTEKCDECSTMEDFYQSNPFGFLLFYERALMGGNKYKQAIVTGWMEVCKELRWSRIACGMVDMLSDRAYAERYIDPKTAPAHIVVRNGEPVMALKEQVDVLLSRPGDKEIMLGHVMDLLKSSGSRGNLTLSTPASNKEGLQRLLKQHRVVVVAFTGDERKLPDIFRAGVQEAVLRRGMNTQVSGAPSDSSDGGRKGKGRSDGKDKWRVGFVAAHGPPGLGAHFGLTAADRSIAAFVDGVLQPGAVTMKPNWNPGDPDVVKAIETTVLAGLEAAGGSPRSGKGIKKTEL